MMNRAYWCILPLCFAFASAHGLPLTGKSINASSNSLRVVPFGTTATNAGAGSTAVVGNDVEFDVLSTQTNARFFTLDLDEDGLVTIAWTFSRSSSSVGFGSTAVNRFRFSDVFAEIAAFTAFDLLSTSDVTGITQSDFSVGADEAVVEAFGGAVWDVGGVLTARISFASASGGSLPEPGTIALLALGLLGARLRERAA